MNINFSLRFAEMHTNAQLMLTSVFNTTCYQIYKLVMTEMMALILVFKFLWTESSHFEFNCQTLWKSPKLNGCCSHASKFSHITAITFNKYVLMLDVNIMFLFLWILPSFLSWSCEVWENFQLAWLFEAVSESNKKKWRLSFADWGLLDSLANSQLHEVSRECPRSSPILNVDL